MAKKTSEQKEKKVIILETNVTPTSIYALRNFKDKDEDVLKKYEELMVRYADNQPVVAQCAGCTKSFDHENGTEMCCVRFNPAAMWPYEGQGFATKSVTVRRQVAGTHKYENVLAEMPTMEKACPFHYIAPEIINTNLKVHAGQGKTRQGGNR